MGLAGEVVLVKQRYRAGLAVQADPLTPQRHDIRSERTTSRSRRNGQQPGVAAEADTVRTSAHGTHPSTVRPRDRDMENEPGMSKSLRGKSVDVGQTRAGASGVGGLA